MTPEMEQALRRWLDTRTQYLQATVQVLLGVHADVPARQREFEQAERELAAAITRWSGSPDTPENPPPQHESGP